MGIYSVISVTFFFNGVSETASSRGLTIPDMLFAAFQMMFSIICVAILTGSVVGRMRFTPLAIFVVFWLLLVYYPFAHMVWDEGLLAKWGTIDFCLLYTSDAADE